MALIFSDDFETGDFSMWTGENDAGGKLDVHADGAYEGNFGMRATIGGAPEAIVLQGLGAGSPVMHMSCRVKLPMLAVIPNLSPWKITDNAAGGPWDIFIRKNGAIFEAFHQLYGAASAAYTTITNFVDDSGWALLEAYAEVGAQQWLRWNGTIIESHACAGGSPVTTTVEVGANGATNWGEFVYLDNFELHDVLITHPTGSVFFVPPAEDDAPVTANEFVTANQTSVETLSAAETALQIVAADLTALEIVSAA